MSVNHHIITTSLLIIANPIMIANWQGRASILVPFYHHLKTILSQGVTDLVSVLDAPISKATNGKVIALGCIKSCVKILKPAQNVLVTLEAVESGINWKALWKTVLCDTCKRYRAALAFIRSHVIGHLATPVFGPTPGGNIWLFSCYMFLCAHHLFVNCDCLLFSAQQVDCSDLFSPNTRPPPELEVAGKPKILKMLPSAHLLHNRVFFVFTKIL